MTRKEGFTKNNAKDELFYYYNSFHDGNNFKSEIKLDLKFRKVTENIENFKNSTSFNFPPKKDKDLREEITKREGEIEEKNKSNKRKSNGPNAVYPNIEKATKLTSQVNISNATELKSLNKILLNSLKTNRNNNPSMGYNQVNVSTDLFPLQHISPNLSYNNNLTVHPNIENAIKLVLQSN
ncbi:hypothetical protein H8356DRAFT_1279135 [Neocallimastix lanati (nom. inval.)]|nr:hypothetical protein H8356DRAFT_1279135 [Neocallimastix sp. JGI-2020a]